MRRVLRYFGPEFNQPSSDTPRRKDDGLRRILEKLFCRKFPCGSCC